MQECTTHCFTCLLTYLLAPCNRVLLEKLTGFQLVNKFPTFYGTRRFINEFISAGHLSLSWSSLTQSTPPHPTSWRSILILTSHLRLGLPSGLFPSGFPNKTLYTTFLFPIRATCHAHLIFSILSREKYWVMSTDHSAPHYAVLSTPLLPHLSLRPNILPLRTQNSGLNYKNCLPLAYPPTCKF